MKRSIRIAAIGIVPALIGASAALLFAPQSGRRTRRQIRLSGERCWYSLVSELERAGELFQGGIDSAQKTARTVGRKFGLPSKAA